MFPTLETLFVSCVSHMLFKLEEMHLTFAFIVKPADFSTGKFHDQK